MRWAVALVGTCLALGGCGSSDDGDGGSAEPAAARDKSVQVAKGAAAAPGADHAEADRVVAEAERVQAAADAERARVAAEVRRDRAAARRARAQARAAAPPPPPPAPAADHGAAPGRGSGTGAPVLHGTYTRLNGERDDLAGYRGRVVLVVNTATACGFTPQFEGLEALYRKRRSEGLVVLGFPANDFAGQEPRSDKEIAKFCKANYGVTFPLFAKTHVIGGSANPLFRALTKAAGAPEWNFTKYLVDRSGRVVARFGSGTEPDGPELKERLDAVL